MAKNRSRLNSDLGKGVKEQEGVPSEQGGVPFAGIVHDLGMVDPDQAALFGVIGKTKAPFQGVANWPYLNDLIRQKSQQLLEAEGEEVWRVAGGKYDA